MPVDIRLRRLVVRGFRGIDSLDLDISDGVPSVLIGSNNAGKSTSLHAIALALRAGGYHKWVPSDLDFFQSTDGQQANEFLVQLLFDANPEMRLPAVRGVGKPVLIHGVQVKARRLKSGGFDHSRTLLDSDHKAVTLAPRTPMADADKEKFSEHGVGFTRVNARLDDIREHVPEVWLFQPSNIEASLYVWKTGPLNKLSQLLADRFLEKHWTYEPTDARAREMPAAVYRAHEFLRDAVEAFPFWATDMKPRLEGIFERYVGSHAKVHLKPDILALKDWLSQQLQVSLATDEQSATTPLKNMGDGWQSIIRLAALEAVSEYPEISKDHVVLLLEEPETHLHPHLRRKMRSVLAKLAEQGWTVVYTTHSAELVSLNEPQIISRLTRSQGRVTKSSIDTRSIEDSARLQSKLDENGAHDFLFGSCAVFCEGRDDSFALRLGLEKNGVDYDARSTSVCQCGSVTAIPAFAEIATSLGIRWCALTDEDTEPTGAVKPATAKVRSRLAALQSRSDALIEWPGNLERSLKVEVGKCVPEVSTERLSNPDWATRYPDFARAVGSVATWIED